MKINFISIIFLTAISLACTKKTPKLTIDKASTEGELPAIVQPPAAIDNSNSGGQTVLPPAAGQSTVVPPSGGAAVIPPAAGNTVIPPAASSTSSQWTGQLASQGISLRSPDNRVATLSQLQAGKSYLILSFYNTNCPLCEFKADAFNQESQKDLVAGSPNCKYVAVVNGGFDPWRVKTTFFNSYVAEIVGYENNVQTSPLVSGAFPQGAEFPAVIVIDSKGDIVLTRNRDFGPQTILSYCKA